MQFGFTEEQEQLRDAVRRFLADCSPTTEVRRLMESDDGYDPEVWRQLCRDLALSGVHIPEAYGGQGFSFAELGVVLEETGRALYCGPYFSTNLGDDKRRPHHSVVRPERRWGQACPGPASGHPRPRRGRRQASPLRFRRPARTPLGTGLSP